MGPGAGADFLGPEQVIPQHIESAMAACLGSIWHRDLGARKEFLALDARTGIKVLDKGNGEHHQQKHAGE